MENFAVEFPDVNGEVGHVHQTSFSHDQTHTYSEGPRLDLYKRRQKNVIARTCSYMSLTGESEKKKEYQPTGYSDIVYLLSIRDVGIPIRSGGHTAPREVSLGRQRPQTLGHNNVQVVVSLIERRQSLDTEAGFSRIGMDPLFQSSPR